MEQVRNWLYTLNLDDYASKFKEYHYTSLEMIKNMSLEEINELIDQLGIKGGDRIVLRNDIGIDKEGLDQYDRVSIDTLYKEGMNSSEIAQKLALSWKAVLMYLCRQKLQVKELDRHDNYVIDALVQKGAKVITIAKKLRVSPKVVEKYLQAQIMTVGTLIEFKTCRGWENGTIAEVNFDHTYDIRRMDGVIEPHWQGSPVRRRQQHTPIKSRCLPRTDDHLSIVSVQHNPHDPPMYTPKDTDEGELDDIISRAVEDIKIGQHLEGVRKNIRHPPKFSEQPAIQDQALKQLQKGIQQHIDNDMQNNLGQADYQHLQNMQRQEQHRQQQMRQLGQDSLKQQQQRQKQQQLQPQQQQQQQQQVSQQQKPEPRSRIGQSQLYQQQPLSIRPPQLHNSLQPLANEEHNPQQPSPVPPVQPSPLHHKLQPKNKAKTEISIVLSGLHPDSDLYQHMGVYQLCQDNSLGPKVYRQSEAPTASHIWWYQKDKAWYVGPRACVGTDNCWIFSEDPNCSNNPVLSKGVWKALITGSYVETVISCHLQQNIPGALQNYNEKFATQIC